MEVERGRRGLPAAGWWALAVVPLATAGLLAVAGLRGPAAALTGGTIMLAAALAGGSLLRLLLSRTSGIASVAGAVIDEVVRMRSTLGLLLVLAAVLPTLPLILDPDERLAYRVQFLLTWTLGGTGLILSLLTAFLSCGSVCGDIDSGRIHMVFAKPLARWQYLLGKWLGIVLYDLLLLAIAGAGIYALVRTVAASSAADPADRQAVDREVLVARRSIEPSPDDPERYDATIAAAIDRLQRDAPDAFAADPGAVRGRIRREYDWQWHTVTADMETTYVFPGAGTGGTDYQLQLEPRANNVDVDFADVRFALWLNDRPWPVRDAEHVEQTLATRARHVLELPAEAVSAAEDLRVRIANRNLIPAGDTRPTAITFPPGTGLVLFSKVGSFEGNYLRCLVILWAKLALVAAVGVAAGAVLDFPLAILVTLVLFVGAWGNDFFREALGSYAVSGETAWEQAAERMAYTAGFVREGRYYEAFRMLFGFVTDGLLWVLPSFSADAAISRVSTGIAIPLQDVLGRAIMFGVLYPLAVGLAGWLVFDRRDLVRSST